MVHIEVIDSNRGTTRKFGSFSGRKAAKRALTVRGWKYFDDGEEGAGFLKSSRPSLTAQIKETEVLPPEKLP